MFSLLRAAHTLTRLSYIGGEGVDGGQGTGDYIYGSNDDSDNYGISSSIGDADGGEFATGEIFDP